jgi:hypothetical protein
VAVRYSGLHPALRKIAANLPRVAAQNGFQVRITSAVRTRAQQAKLYRDYINGLAIYPASPPGTSAHEKGLALDILSTNPSALIGLLTSVGLYWAGPDDPIHFQIVPFLGSSGPRTNDLSEADLFGRQETFGESWSNSWAFIKKFLF